MNSISVFDEKSRTAAIIESLEVGVILLDLDGIVTHINELAAIILGTDRGEVLGFPFDALEIGHPHYLRIRSALRRASSYPAGEQQVEVSLHVRGREHNYLLKPAPLRLSDGRSFGTIVTLQDITSLRDRDRARTNLVATLSHELKTPLTSVSLAVELLQRNIGPPDRRYQELIDTVVEDLARIRELSDSLLNLARGETASIAVRNVRFDFARLVTSVTRKFAIQTEQKNVRLGVKAEPELESHGDPIKLSWVLSNLVANALRYTPDGGSIEVCAKRAGPRLRLSVSDTGPGIPSEIREVMFERFAQWAPNGFESGSAGLGLAIAKEIVEAHGGRIFVESSEAGSTFTVDLPRSRSI